MVLRIVAVTRRLRAGRVHHLRDQVTGAILRVMRVPPSLSVYLFYRMTRIGRAAAVAEVDFGRARSSSPGLPGLARGQPVGQPFDECGQ
jgi:hypothetical protein